MAARNGILIKDRLALEQSRTVDAFLFDKTGTLTKGEHAVVGVAAVGVIAFRSVVERRQQDRLLMAVRQSGANGVAMRDLYRKLNLSAKQARQLAQDLIRAGLIEERRIERAEAYIASEFLVQA